MLASLQDRVFIEASTLCILINKNTIKTSSNNLVNNINKNNHNLDEEILFRKFCIDINFELREDLIYYVDSNIEKHTKLCISILQKKEIFRTIYDKHHIEIHQCFQRITKMLYILRLLRKLRTYIEHCLLCQINQIKRYRFYDKLMSISLLTYSFYTIAINFIVILLEKYDCLLTITNKFSRRLLLLFDYVMNFVAI